MNAFQLACFVVTTLAVSASADSMEIRAIKVRIPGDADAKWIEHALNRIARAHFNTVVLETFYHGYTIFESGSARHAGITAQRPPFHGWDPMEVFLKEAHKRGIGVQAWVETFYVGNDQIEGPGPIITAHPDWALRRANGRMNATGAEETYYYLCPANKEVRRYIGDVYVEIARRFPVEAIFIDYLRYPLKSLGPAEPFCYCDICRKRVKDELGLELSEIPLAEKNEKFLKWTRWREDQTTQTMRYLSERLRKFAPEVPIIGNVHGGYRPEPLERDTLRDWVKWVKEGLVDVISTQNYSSDDAAVEAQMKRDLSYLPEGTRFWPALNIKEVDTGCHQLESARKLTDLGAAYFVYGWLTDERTDALIRGPFKDKVSAPHRHSLLLRPQIR